MNAIRQTINENAARQAHNMYSMRDYAPNEATAEYNMAVDRAEQLANEEAEKRPECAAEIEVLLNRYAKQLADFTHEGYSIELMCPSVMISGASNFPVRRKEKQNARRDSHWAKWDHIKGILEQIKAVQHKEKRESSERTEAGTSIDGVTIAEDIGLQRIQIIFDGNLQNMMKVWVDWFV